VTYSGTSHQWLVRGARANRTLPTIWVHMCRVAQVAPHSASGSGGQGVCSSAIAIGVELPIALLRYRLGITEGSCQAPAFTARNSFCFFCCFSLWRLQHLPRDSRLRIRSFS